MLEAVKVSIFSLKITRLFPHITLVINVLFMHFVQGIAMGLSVTMRTVWLSPHAFG